jgi:hypothetical protein
MPKVKVLSTVGAAECLLFNNQVTVDSSPDSRHVSFTYLLHKPPDYVLHNLIILHQLFCRSQSPAYAGSHQSEAVNIIRIDQSSSSHTVRSKQQSNTAASTRLLPLVGRSCEAIPPAYSTPVLARKKCDAPPKKSLENATHRLSSTQPSSWDPGQQPVRWQPGTRQ